jgi:hypothetical protein
MELTCALAVYALFRLLDVGKSMKLDVADLCARASARGITIYQRSKTVWIAAGGHRGRDLEVKGRSQAIALALWIEATQYRGTV